MRTELLSAVGWSASSYSAPYHGLGSSQMAQNWQINMEEISAILRAVELVYVPRSNGEMRSYLTLVLKRR